MFRLSLYTATCFGFHYTLPHVSAFIIHCHMFRLSRSAIIRYMSDTQKEYKGTDASVYSCTKYNNKHRLRKCFHYSFFSSPHLLSILPYFALFCLIYIIVSHWSYLRKEPGWLSRYSDSLRAGRPGDRIPVGGEIFRTRPDRPWGPPSLLYNGYRLFPGGKAAGAWR